uniref:Uncharacterized protein n=1 Tax=Romanomermis culicivorax TaxID=13658 RepID=A0A915JL47_ROMCU
MSALDFMMRDEAISTYKITEEQVSEEFYCPPNISNSDAQLEPVPRRWYPWIERKLKTPKKKKVRGKNGEPECDLDVYDFMASKSVVTRGETKDIKNGRLRQGVLQKNNVICLVKLHGALNLLLKNNNTWAINSLPMKKAHSFTKKH